MRTGRDDGVLRWTRRVLSAVGVLNLVSAAGFAGALLLTVPFDGYVRAHLAAKYGPGLDAAQLVWALRVLMLLGIGACGAVRAVLRPLAGVIGTVERGDPFVAENADRLEGVGRGLLAWQLADLAFGAVVAWIDRLGADHATWVPSITGWVMVLLMFVLARVFRRGTDMRDELAGTV